MGWIHNIVNWPITYHESVNKKDYRIRLNLSVETYRFFLKGSLPFRGNNEKEDPSFSGLFLELYDLLANLNEETRNS